MVRIMLIAAMAFLVVWGISLWVCKSLSGIWGISLPTLVLSMLIVSNLNLSFLKGMMVLAMLATLAMLFNPRLRNYVLLPSGLALAGGLATISLNYNYFGI